MTRGDPFDGFYVDWFLPPPKVVSGRLEEFTYEDFRVWIKDASPEMMALPHIQDVNKNLSADAVVVSCKLPRGIMKAFTNTQGLSGKVPREVSDAANDFIKRRDSNTNWFIFVPKDVITKREIIPRFARRANEDFGMLSQYWDADGNYLLHKIEDAPTVNQVGNGMYVKDPREIQQLHHPRFFTPVQSLQVFMGITKAKKPTWATKLFYKTPSTKPRPRRWPESPSILKLLTLSSRTSS